METCCFGKLYQQIRNFTSLVTRPTAQKQGFYQTHKLDTEPTLVIKKCLITHMNLKMSCSVKKMKEILFLCHYFACQLKCNIQSLGSLLLLWQKYFFTSILFKFVHFEVVRVRGSRKERGRSVKPLLLKYAKWAKQGYDEQTVICMFVKQFFECNFI